MLYISFWKPQHADDSEMEDNLVYHYRGSDLVGITVIGAKKYGASAGRGSMKIHVVQESDPGEAAILILKNLRESTTRNSKKKIKLQ